MDLVPPADNVLLVTPDEEQYFRRHRPMHYLALQEMIRHGEAKIVTGAG